MTNPHNTSKTVVVIFYYRKSARYAFNVLTAAIENCHQLQQVRLVFPSNKEELWAAINSYQTQFTHVLVAWSFYSPEFQQISVELQAIKSSINPGNVIHIAGGVHATAVPRQTLESGFKFVAIGEGEQIIIDLLMQLTISDDINSLTGIKGIAYLDNQQLHKNNKGTAVNLNQYPACPSNYNKYGPIEITRGCIYACRFCQTPHINKARFRHRSVSNILSAVDILKSVGSKDYRFLTPTALSYGSDDKNVNHQALEHLLKSVRTSIGTERRLFFGTFPSEIRPEHIDEQVLMLLKRYVDNDNLIIGGQSGSQALLDSSRRGHDVKCIVQAVKLCNKFGFKPNVDLLFGLPGETKIDVDATIKLAHTLIEAGAKIHNHTFMPLPGTPFRDKAPGNISIETQKQLQYITSKGHAYGNWQKQMSIAKQLSSQRRSK